MNIKIDKRKGKYCFICGVLKKEAIVGCWRSKRHYYGRAITFKNKPRPQKEGGK